MKTELTSFWIMNHMIQSDTIQTIQEMVHAHGILKQSMEKLLLRFLEIVMVSLSSIRLLHTNVTPMI